MRIDPSQLVTLQEFAWRAGTSRTAVSGALARRELEPIKIGGRWYLSVADLEGFCAARRAKDKRAAPKPAA